MAKQAFVWMRWKGNSLDTDNLNTYPELRPGWTNPPLCAELKLVSEAFLQAATILRHN